MQRRKWAKPYLGKNATESSIVVDIKHSGFTDPNESLRQMDILSKNMNQQQFTSFVVNQPYPLPLPGIDGGIAEFLRKSGNLLLIVMPNITEEEAAVLKNGDMYGGLLKKDGEMLFIWQFFRNGKPVITLDSPFNARIIPDIQFFDIKNEETRLVIDIHIVDSASNIIKGLRAITMPPELTLQFLSATQDQLALPFDHNNKLLKQWMTIQPEALAKQIKMFQMGN
jgi:hypothetical protein